MSSERSFRGRPVVFGMFAFALLVSFGLWGYWEMHTRPFRALTDELGETFPGSSPRVEGGKAGMHKQTDRVLRIVMRVDYDPLQANSRYQRQQAEILSIASGSGTLMDYDNCEIHLFYQPAELQHQMRSITIPRS
ncbi:MAG: hypothetical protein JKY95_17090, partial [Planctomycetaceae bacterium]|nr:hypothetical protein [Planctomycetaceae bacterium]